MNSQDRFDATLDALKKSDGDLWVRILGQTHWQYNELPFWVLVRNPEQIRSAIPYLQEKLRPLQSLDEADITVSFLSFDGPNQTSYGMFKGDAFFEDAVDQHLYAEPFVSPREKGVFDAEYPNDAWALS